MPLREQSRIKADTVAEECTCEECPYPAPDVAPTGFRIVGRSGPGVPLPPGRTWVRFGWYSSGARAGTNGSSLDAFDPPVMVETLDDMARGSQWDKGCWEILEPIPAPAFEPSAPPARVTVCKAPGWCGLPYGDDKVPREWHGPRGMPWGVPIGGSPRVLELPAYCSGECQNGRPLNPPPSAPVTVATGGTVSAHPAPFAHDCDIVPDDEIPTAEECAETVKRLGIDVSAWAADVRKRVASVATGGVPTVWEGLPLAPGWILVPAPAWLECEVEPSCHRRAWYQRDPLPSMGTPGPRYACDSHCLVAGAVIDSRPPVDADVIGACAQAGALVPVDTARSVPPGPVPVEAWLPLNSGEWIVLRGYGSAGWRTVGPRRESQEEAQLDAEHGSMRGSPLDTGTATDTGGAVTPAKGTP